MKDQEHDELWALLGRAKRLEPSPFFVAKVMTAIRHGNERRVALWRNWLRYGLPSAFAGALAVLLAYFSFLPHHSADHRTIVVAQTEPGDLDVIADLDVVMSSEESSVWLDSSAH